MPKKPQFPFMVFAESVPDATRLHAPSTMADERELILAKVDDAVEVVKSIATGNRRGARHRDSHHKRDRIMRDAKYVPGKRGEPKRIASKYGVSPRTVEKWIAQLRAPEIDPPADWRTVYHGRALRNYQRELAQKRWKTPKT